MKKLIIIYFSLLVTITAKADEGMWLPFLLKQLNSEEMYIRGLKIPVEEIYNANKNCLKDAVALFGGGCTGEMISYEGLLLTNHHCGYSNIQSHSSIEKNYLRDGFWAFKKTDEIPCPGLTVSFIIRMENVSQQIIPFLNDSMPEAERNNKVRELAGSIEKSAIEGTHYNAQVKAIFEGNEYILIVSETFKDIRMVGAPPSSIGNFGGETDNWMWPRQTGDFSLFRVYADKDNKPAAYNIENVPFRPRYAFSISLNGVKEGDFTMVYGFPGTTQEYLSSYAVDATMNVSDPNRIAIRDKKIAVMHQYMQEDEKVFIQYAAKLRRMANAYKKWKGEIKGLKQLDAIQRKRTFENDFTKWCSLNIQKNKKYNNLINQFSDIYKDYTKFITAADYHAEAALGIELVNYALAFNKLVEYSLAEKPDQKKIDTEAERLLKASESYFKNYHAPLDEKMMAELCAEYFQHVDAGLMPPALLNANSKYKGDFAKYASMVFDKSFFVSQEKVKKLLDHFTTKKAKQISKDPAYILANDFMDTYNVKVGTIVIDKRMQLAPLNRIYMAGIREMQEGRKIYPDANSTLRVAFGTVQGYNPKDGAHYDYMTTIEGIMEKMDSTDEDFVVPKRLVDLYNKKDYGRYGVSGTMPVAFIASNHTTGGNSGSPVLNDKGLLIGTNFDRVWEGTMSDIMFDRDRCRNITVDIRYTLFIIDKFAGAGNLIKEMDIIN